MIAKLMKRGNNWYFYEVAAPNFKYGPYDARAAAVQAAIAEGLEVEPIEGEDIDLATVPSESDDNV